MNNIYDGFLDFKGTFRPYQRRILDHSNDYLKDNKMHIVAAPGSGKTTLGIELIRRLGKRALIVSPRIVIRDQWIQRVKDAFIINDGLSLSSSLINCGDITSITYQTLFSAMTHFKGKEKEDNHTDDILKEETVDYSHFDLIQNIKEHHIEVICLDECHHLHKEWWKALEDFMNALGKENLIIISLTATPPYDSIEGEWIKYTNMCGEVDQEISIPELVKEGNLCPHQDYVLFSYPTKEEKKMMKEHCKKILDIFNFLMNEPILIDIVSKHKAIHDYEHYYETMLSDPMYLSSLLIYLNSHHISFDKRWKKLLSIKSFPPMTIPFMEKLLQSFLFDDPKSYQCEESYRNSLIIFLKKHHLIIKKKVVLSQDDHILSLLSTSMSKLPNITKICQSEYSSRQDSLRMLILTDYIKKEYINYIGTKEAFNDIGVIPIFETLRRTLDKHCQLAILCGSLIVIPGNSINRFKELINDKSYHISLFYKSYYQISVNSKNSEIVSLITQLFEEGYFQIMIGTKSLLGEGYDSPCINSLIMASFVGSYVLSNQMRGRAIRTYSKKPNKTANIWHLVCIDNADESKKLELLGIHNSPSNEDYALLQRKFKAFLGVSYDGLTIENGISRLSIFQPLTPKNIDKTNKLMLSLSKESMELKRKWEQALISHDETVIEFQKEKESIKTKTYFTDLIAGIIINTFLIIINVLINTIHFSFLRNNLNQLIIIGALLLNICLLGFFTIRIYLRLSPGHYIKSIGQAIYDALKEKQEITTISRIVTEQDRIYQSIYLKQGSLREKELFAKCIDEFLGPIENQRYLLYYKKGAFRYFVVPSIFEKNKQDAELFLNHLKRHLGPVSLIYTRNIKGRKILLKARSYSYGNNLQRLNKENKEDCILQKFK